MGKSFPRFTSGQVNWSDTGAGGLAIPHLFLGAFLIISLLRHDFAGFAIGMALDVTVTAFGILVIYFVAQAQVRDSERYARYSYCLAIAYLCFSVGILGISWTYLVGNAIVSVVYLVESVIILVYARRTVRELRQ